MVKVYEIDGIERLEAELSRGLARDPERARRIALRRIGRLDDTVMWWPQRAAIGLSKVVQYGIDRNPAIVFDGEAVVYGVTDIEQALHCYRQWQRASSP